jgi:hypothetical protein
MRTETISKPPERGTSTAARIAKLKADLEAAEAEYFDHAEAISHCAPSLAFKLLLADAKWKVVELADALRIARGDYPRPAEKPTRRGH